MSVTNTKTTELQAVNAILSAVGEPPVTGLGTTDSTNVEQVLQESYIVIQEVGWSWNTRAHIFTSSASGASFQYIVPDSIIRLDLDETDERNLTIRNNYIYDLENNTNLFTTSGSKTIDVVELLAWVDLPQSARTAIVRRASRMYLQRYLPDSALLQTARIDEEISMLVLKREEHTHGNYSIFQNGIAGYPSRNAINKVI
jgi:hypothetical protein